MSAELALLGGNPVRQGILPYARQSVSRDEIALVDEVLAGDWLTTGPMVGRFEQAMASFLGATHAAALSSGTAGLHAALAASGIQAGDEVIVPAMTFVATANAVVYLGARPRIVDVSSATLLLDPVAVEAAVTSRTKAVIAVDYAGQTCRYRELRRICDRHGLVLIDDACHSLGARYNGRPLSDYADLVVHSFHPAKHMTTGEGGIVATHDPAKAAVVRAFRNHGLSADLHERESQGTWVYWMTHLGFNYRLTDIQCALGLGQLSKLPAWIQRRREIARAYDAAFARLPGVTPVARRTDAEHVYHLYVVRFDRDRLSCDRDQIYRALRAEGIGVNVHYIPVNLHPYYQAEFGTGPGLCPVAEAAAGQILSLPLFSSMTAEDVQDVIEGVRKVAEYYEVKS